MVHLSIAERRLPLALTTRVNEIDISWYGSQYARDQLSSFHVVIGWPVLRGGTNTPAVGSVPANG